MADLLNERKIISRENQEIFLQKRSGEIPYKEEEKEEDRYVSKEEEKKGGGGQGPIHGYQQHNTNQMKSVMRKVSWKSFGASMAKRKRSLYKLSTSALIELAANTIFPFEVSIDNLEIASEST